MITRDHGGALVNPGMGWTMHYYSNQVANYGSKLVPSDTLDDFPGLSTVYLRVPWAFLEPQRGRFNWALLDTPAQRWIARGRRVAMRITCSENWIAYATPEWVRQAGAAGVPYEFGKGPQPDGRSWDPVFDDPVFLAELDRFLAALARRYDGNPNVEFVDIGSFGLWGEGHTHMSSRQDRIDIQKKHVDLHVRHFRQTQLCISDDFAGHDRPGRDFPITDYALSQGVTLRDDSILVQPAPRCWFHAEMAEKFWPKMPVIIEHEHYAASKRRNAWDGRLLERSVEDYHASFMSIHGWPRELLEENRDTIERINRRLGYRLQPTRVDWPGRVEIGRPFAVKWTWANKGVAPCYGGGWPCLTLKDDRDGIVAVLVDESRNVGDLQVGPPGAAPAAEWTSEFTAGHIAPVTNPGRCHVYVSVGARDGTPILALPLGDEDGRRRYRLGSIDLAAGEASA
ncbi:MAG: DUF4832 domain-containing protein [Planctomycetes bacterium]|nr:DUF4832 domain-containing protein [Planctomycetota bacterium]